MNASYWNKIYKEDRHEAIVRYLYSNPHVLGIKDIIKVSKEPKYYKHGELYVIADLEIYTDTYKYIIEVKSSHKQRHRARQQISKVAELEAYNDNTYIYLVWPFHNGNFKKAINSLVIEMYKPKEIYKGLIEYVKQR